MEILLDLFISACMLIHSGDASSYHVAFLGRANPSESVGSFQFKTSGDKPEITSAVPLCTDAEDVGTIVSRVILNHTECVNLIPQGTEFATRGIAVRSEDKFTLHVFQPFKNEDLGDGYLAIPDDQLGNEYFVATYCTLGGKCQFAITAIEDDTDVTVVFPDELVDPPVCVSRMGMPKNIQPGTAIPFKINEYDTLHFESEQDLSGTFIKASKPISVVVGASDVPGVGGKASSIIEQIVPVNKWGDSFIVAPNHFNQPGDVIKIVSQTDSTDVNILGFSSFMLNKAGDFVERRMDWQMYSLIKTSNPVMIIQIMSIDLYNISTIVSGSQSMLLVPHLKQTIEDGVYFYCEAQEEKVFSVLVPNDGSVAITEPSDDSLYEVLIDLEDIQEASYKLYTVKPSPSVEHVVLSGENLIGYGNCDGSSTFLLAANWSVDNSECIRTISTPGDAVDNDCNGRIDEMQCSLDDLATSFRAIQKLHGAVTYKIFPVRQRTSLKFEVATCGIAIVTLRTTDNSKTVTISIGSSDISMIVCNPECQNIIAVPNSAVSDCRKSYLYEISWNDDIALLYNGHKNLINALEAPIDFDDVLFSTFLGSASYKIFLPEKDCNKLYRGEGTPDSYGYEFLIPVSNTDIDYTIIVTTKKAEPVYLAIKLPGRTNALTNLTVMANARSKWIPKRDVPSAEYNSLRLQVTSGAEVVVYVLRQRADGKQNGFNVIPTDVLGPRYHLYEPNAEPITAVEGVCNVFALIQQSYVTGIGNVKQDSFIKVTGQTKDLKYRRLLHADSPVAVFCGKSGYESFAQMPPRETLGIKHYIPPFKFDDIGITDAVVYVTAVEDSTIVVIKGDYHQLDSVTLTGDVYSRKIESVTMYDIEATKPVQVHLVIENTTGDRHGLVVIPSIEHYTQDFNMFEMIDTYEYTGVVVGVDANGTVGNITLGEPLPHEMFVMSFFKQTVDDILFVVTNGRKYTDINKFCVVTPSNPGDGLDNDCDDLIDEEDCSESIESGNIDVDIDGGVNEDCAENTLGLAENIALLDVLYQDTQCSSEGVISVPNSDTDEEVTDVRAKGANNYLEISGTIQDFNDTTKHTFNPRNGKTDSRPILMILSTVPTIKIGTLLNIPNSGSSPVPIETCTTDCICPCGWVYEQNITAAEIQMKVIELVRKLTLDKDQLSATIRKKTSAMDKRPSAYTVGTVALIWMAVMIGSVVFLDISSVMRDLKLFRENMRQIFRREKEKKPDC